VIYLNQARNANVGALSSVTCERVNRTSQHWCTWKYETISQLSIAF